MTMTKREERRKRSIGRFQRDNVRLEQQERQLADQLRARGINPNQSTKELDKLLAALTQQGADSTPDQGGTEDTR